MQKVTVIAVGKLKEAYLEAACKEYSKRLCGYCSINIIELNPARAYENSAASVAAAVEDEGKRIFEKIPPRAFIIPMCIEGKQLDSVKFSKLITDTAINGYSDICFIIGGSYGLSQKIKSAASFKLSMSEMTFPHQLARVMLLEQIYRAFKINEGSSYHK